MIPLVRFLTSTGDILQSVTHKEFTMELGSRVVARRIQLPLKLVLIFQVCDLGMGNLDSQIARNDNRLVGCGLERCI